MDAWLLLPEKVRRYGEIIVPCGSIGAGSYRRWRICAGAQLEAALGVTLGRYN